MGTRTADGRAHRSGTVIRDAEAAGLRLDPGRRSSDISTCSCSPTDDAGTGFFADYQDRIDGELRRVIAPATGDRVQEAMAYTLLAPSKRVRPV